MRTRIYLRGLMISYGLALRTLWMCWYVGQTCGRSIGRTCYSVSENIEGLLWYLGREVYAPYELRFDDI